MLPRVIHIAMPNQHNLLPATLLIKAVPSPCPLQSSSYYPYFRIRILPYPSNLLNRNPPTRLVHRLRHHNLQHSILHARLDGILIHASGELKAAMELADGTLADPVLALRLSRLLGRFVVIIDDGLLHRLLRRRRSSSSDLLLLLLLLPAVLHRLILHGGLVALGRLGARRDGFLLPGGGGGGVFDGVAAGGRRRPDDALDLALDDDGVGVRELDQHVLLLDARELAFEQVAVFLLADVELGLEGAHGRGGEEAVGVAVAVAVGSMTVRAVHVVVVDEAEEGGEVAVGEAGEEGRHGFGLSGFDDGFGRKCFAECWYSCEADG